MTNPVHPSEIATKLLSEYPPLDRLPYTATFDEIHERFCTILGNALSKSEVWWKLVNARKRGQGRAKSRNRKPTQ